jgi:hypothetical protein
MQASLDDPTLGVLTLPDEQRAPALDIAPIAELIAHLRDGTP